MPTCIFCGVVKENKPFHEIVFSDRKHIAFLDINPTNYGHVLVVPKKHTDYLLDLNEKDYVDLLKASRLIALCLKKALKSKYIYFFVKGARIKHVHVHLIPISKNEAGHLPRKNINKMKFTEIGQRLRKFIKKV